MAGDERDAIADQLMRECYRLLGVAEVVADDQLDLLAEDVPAAFRSSTASPAPR